jgi:hypothetical protein
MMKNVENCSENGNENFGCDGTMRWWFSPFIERLRMRSFHCSCVKQVVIKLNLSIDSSLNLENLLYFEFDYD